MVMFTLQLIYYEQQSACTDEKISNELYHDLACVWLQKQTDNMGTFDHIRLFTVR